MTDLVTRIYQFNRKFDYGEYHDDPLFWTWALRHQVDEMEESYEADDMAHYGREAADAVLVAFQAMQSMDVGAAPPLLIRERIANAEEVGIEENVVPKYKRMWEAVNAEESPSALSPGAVAGQVERVIRNNGGSLSGYDKHWLQSAADYLRYLDAEAGDD